MSTSALRPSDLLATGDLRSSDSVSKRVADATRHIDHSFVFRQKQLEAEASGKGSGRNYVALGIVVIVAHVVGLYFYINTQHIPVVKPRPVEIEIIKPVIEPPPEVKPPPPPPPPPPKKVQPPPKPALKTPEAVPEPDIQPEDIVIPENTTAEPTPGPVEAAPPEPPAPPAPPPEEPVTEAFGGLGYLNNPPPKYPPFAARQGWQGTVTLRVRVLANGSVERIEVAKSSGRKVLDDAAIAAAKGWEFAPSKRGNTPIDGWATVPVQFTLN
ncbi:energy transducer TonB [Methylobacillus arboreus]|uniref:energy transducer TonB n=1 Tax=Methylobacillus arboreus TaxID=755170 RepID=UPI001E2D4D9C|nr:energy transducer TonB [Methylobacillus arboreus]MCB5189900.1 energy transducer TonB [Methylobacillus arboreus]